MRKNFSSVSNGIVSGTTFRSRLIPIRSGSAAPIRCIRSLMCTSPTALSKCPLTSGKRVCLQLRAISSVRANGWSTSSTTTSLRGVITSRTRTSFNSSALIRISRSVSVTSCDFSLSATSSAISSALCTCSLPVTGSIRTTCLSNQFAVPFSAVISHRNTM